MKDYVDTGGGSSNLYCNQGGGLEFYALDDRGGRRRVATLKRKDEIGEEGRTDSCTVDYNLDYFEAGSGGKCKDGYRFGVENGRLVFRTTGGYLGQRFSGDEFGVSAAASFGKAPRPSLEYIARLPVISEEATRASPGRIIEQNPSIGSL